jgi:predicted enzyme related to lactoylglutathione lyase
MALFNVPDGYYLRVNDVNSLAVWYQEKLGFVKVKATDEDEGCEAVLKTAKGDLGGIGLGSASPSTGPTPIIYTGSIRKAHETLSDRNVQVAPIQQDAQGTNYFQFTDCEGNVLEISEEP